MTLSELAGDEMAVIQDMRQVKQHGHGKVIVEIRERKTQMVERTLRTAYKS